MAFIDCDTRDMRKYIHTHVHKYYFGNISISFITIISLYNYCDYYPYYKDRVGRIYWIQQFVFRGSTQVAKACQYRHFLPLRPRGHPSRVLGRASGQLFNVVRATIAVWWIVSNQWVVPGLIGILTRAGVPSRKLPERKSWSSTRTRKTNNIPSRVGPSSFEKRQSDKMRGKRDRWDTDVLEALNYCE